MKIFNRIILVVAVLLISSRTWAQPTPTTQSLAVKQEKELVRFDLDFPGGTPGELVAAIQKATGRPLNAIIPDQYADQKLPPLKMKGVNVSQLFTAMFVGSRKRLTYTSIQGNPYPQEMEVMSGFQKGENSGPLTDDSVWVFVVTGAPANPDFCRFYLLTPYLQAGLTVDDITTAIQTSWKMLGDVKPSKLSFHKETKLLIAVGTISSLQIIDDVLKALDVQQKTPAQPAPPVEAQTAK